MILTLQILNNYIKSSLVSLYFESNFSSSVFSPSLIIEVIGGVTAF